ncbi:hypothetical protein D3C78_1620720 [compost metagenome]
MNLGFRKYVSTACTTAIITRIYTILINPPILKAMAQSGINEMITPITGMSPKIKIMIARANKLGKPKIHRKMVDNIELTSAIRN